MFRLSRAQFYAAVAAVYAAVFVWLSSLILIHGSGIADQYQFHFWQWPYFAWMYWDDPNWHAWLIISAIPAALGPLVLFALIYRRRRHIQGWFMMMRHPPTQPWTRHAPAQSHGNAAFVRDAARRMRR